MLSSAKDFTLQRSQPCSDVPDFSKGEVGIPSTAIGTLKCYKLCLIKLTSLEFASFSDHAINVV